MANAYFYSNIAVATTLTGNINNSVTTCTVAASTGWPGTFPYIVALDYGGASEELVKVTANASNTLTIVRAFGGTSAVSHSTGAVVRHVANAQDLTDFRTHEAATGAVHGLTGSIVGTSDSQTLTNKTLTAPTITNPTVSGGGSLAGTFSGSPTFSGLPVFSGGANFTGAVTHSNDITTTRATAGTAAFQALVTADTFDRFRIYADGKQEWGSGSGARDVELFREAADTLTTNDTMRVYRSTTSGDALQTRVTGDTVSRLNVDADGTMSWGPGGAAAQDTNLYRSASDTLKTDDSLVVVGSLTAGNITTGAWTSYTPTWGSSGSAPSLGNGTLVGKYVLVGKACTCHINLIMGSTTTYGSGIWNWLLPFTSVNDGTTRVGNAHMLSGGYRACGNVVISPNDTNVQIYLSASTTDTRLSAVTPTVPITFSQSDQIRISFTYEIA